MLTRRPGLRGDGEDNPVSEAVSVVTVTVCVSQSTFASSQRERRVHRGDGRSKGGFKSTVSVSHRQKKSPIILMK